jgi:hypothetical protein
MNDPMPPQTPDLQPSNDPAEVTLAPRPWVALGVVTLGAACLLLPIGWPAAGWLALATGLFGGFLLLQSALLRLRFNEEALLVLRGETEICRFPYEEWLGWKLFLPAVPVLFYFRERTSIHLLPVLFDATSLREQLEKRLGRLDPPKTR